MFFSLIRYCYRSSPTLHEDSSSSSSSTALTTVTITRSLYRHVPLCPERRRIEGTRRWRPALCAISEDASTIFFAGESERRRSRTNVSFGNFLNREMTSFNRKESTMKKAWRNTFKYQIASPGFSPAFMY
ncbi:hypothetical protein AALP_AA1G050400 [Arabis alpina]|uniref:Uncharacterized protein n=1 Tax=Arabis alpina TaxID=50452 RepID=A0A087HL75_ARAAL|nr:hypothetical protein AALP_AA1G050400 [Arabis alpina]